MATTTATQRKGTAKGAAKKTAPKAGAKGTAVKAAGKKPGPKVKADGGKPAGTKTGVAAKPPAKAVRKSVTKEKVAPKPPAKAVGKAVTKVAAKPTAKSVGKTVTKEKAAPNPPTKIAAKSGTKEKAVPKVAAKAGKPEAAAPQLFPPAASGYDESKIKTLSSLEHIRLRTGMYIGRLGDGSNPDDGIYVLLKEVIDNAIDEFIMGNGKLIEVSVEEEKPGLATVKVRDYGRGIPLGKLVECVSVINTGAKYNDEVFQFSVGLNGVGTKAVNALSLHFRVISIRDGEFAEAVFERGNLKSQRKGRLKEKRKNGTYVEFSADPEIFPEYAYNPAFIEKRVKNYAYLNSGLTLSFNGKQFACKRGLFDLLDEETGDEALYPLGYYKGAPSANGQLEFAFTHTGNYGESYFSFVNGQHTSDGGTHLSAFKEGFLKGIQAFFKKDYRSEDVREGGVAA
ncbi:MAG: ATP-binding protein, partial [Treponema sp.]|nr:ATP-binding protein [Treponema sp.]